MPSFFIESVNERVECGYDNREGSGADLGQQALNQQEYMNKRTIPTHVMTMEIPSSMYSSFKRIITQIY